MKYQISSIAYGDAYSMIFLDQFLRSFVDDTNLGWLKKNHETSFLLFTDEESMPKITNHKAVQELDKHIDLEVVVLEKKLTYENRYQALAAVTKHSVKTAIEKKVDYVSQFSADAVFASSFFETTLANLGDHDAIFCVPLRSAHERVYQELRKFPGPIPAQELFKLAFSALHPLWEASNWDSPRFSNIPYTMNWSTPTGLLVRTFSVSPIVFKPLARIADTGSLDLDAPSLFTNPYWAEDWYQVPIIGAEPLACFYSPFSNVPANADFVGRVFARTRVHPTQVPNLKRPFYYPSKKVALSDRESLIYKSETIAEDIRSAYADHMQ